MLHISLVEVRSRIRQWPKDVNCALMQQRLWRNRIGACFFLPQQHLWLKTLIDVADNAKSGGGIRPPRCRFMLLRQLLEFAPSEAIRVAGQSHLRVAW